MAQRTPTPTEIAAQTGQKRTRLISLGLILLVAAIGLVSFWAYKEIQKAEESLEDRLADRARILVDDRVGAVDGQVVKTILGSATRLLEAPMFTFFASAVHDFKGDIGLLIEPENKDDKTGGLSEEDKDDLDKLMESLPLMVVYLRDSVTADGFVSGRILSVKGDTYLSTFATPPPLTPVQQKYVELVAQNGFGIVSELYPSPSGIVFDLILPFYPPSYESRTDKPVSVLMLTKAATGPNNLTGIVQQSTVAGEGFEVNFIQKSQGGFERLDLGASSIAPIKDPEGIEKEVLPFGVRNSLDGREMVYSMGRLIPGTDWWIVQERSYLASRLDYHQTVQRTIILAVLAALVLALLVIVFWWRLVGKEQEEIAGRFRQLAEVIGEQKQLLDGINSTISDPISLRDTKGVYRYVNKAFGEAVGRPAEEVIGLDATAVFGFDTAKRLVASDNRVMEDKNAITVDETIWLMSKRHYFQISKAALEDDKGGVTGIVSVFRDITKQVEAQERGSRMVQQTIHALVRAIEASDPFLGGHSRIMGQVALQIAKTLGLSGRDTATVEAAASLSQIGKMFVPREVLTKPGMLTEDEKKTMEQHVEFAREVLKDIEFELPVLEAVCQMNERLDGKGYPKGLKADEIGVPARVLAVANAFTAMARPRSYRQAMRVDKVLSILQQNANEYDPRVVEALAKVLTTPAGERLVAQAASSQA